MESEEVISLRRALELQRQKNKELKRQLKLKSQERVLHRQNILESSSTDLDMRLEQLQNLARKEQESEAITTRLQSALRGIIQEKVDLESMLDQEQELIINTMSRQVTQALAEKLYFLYSELQRKLEALNKSASDADSSVHEEQVSDTSGSSDTEKESEERRRLKLLETELACTKQQMRFAKRELRKYKNMHKQIQEKQHGIAHSEGGDTDRSDFSIESNRSFCQESNQDTPNSKK